MRDLIYIKKCLRKQLGLLSKASESTYENELSDLTNSMCEICKLYKSCFPIFFAVLAYFTISFHIFIKYFFRRKF